MQKIIKNVLVVPNEKEQYKGSIAIKDGKIVDIEDIDSSQAMIIDGKGAICMPGMIDMHIHGSYGYDVIRNPKECIPVISKGLVAEGTTSFLASLTVISHEDMLKLLKEYQDVKAPCAHFLGIHSEGPYLSKEYKALMDETYLRDPQIKELDEMIDASSNQIAYMTIAPEREGACEFIQYATNKGICMMIGHTNATCQQALKGLEAGAKGFTHLYNCMSQHSHRSPGTVTAALRDQAYCEMIVDGFHTHPDVVYTTYKILGSKHIILITDAMLARGMKDGKYTFSNLKCEKHGNTVQVIETGRIAGSAISQLDAIHNMRKFCNCSLNELVEMACVNPSIVLNRKDIGKLEAGRRADFILLDSDLNLLATYVDGTCVYQK